MLARLRNYCNHTSTSRCVLAGDFNFVLEAEDRYRPTQKRFTGQREADGKYFLEHFSDFLEAQQSDYTRQGGRGDHTVLSRLDRIYFSISPWEANDFNISAGINRDLGGTQEDLSDHFSVWARLGKKVLLPRALDPLQFLLGSPNILAGRAGWSAASDSLKICSLVSPRPLWMFSQTRQNAIFSVPLAK